MTDDKRMIGLVYRDLVAAEAHYHHSCYRGYTRQKKVSTKECGSHSSFEYATVDAETYELLYEYMRQLLENSRVVKLGNQFDRKTSVSHKEFRDTRSQRINQEASSSKIGNSIWCSSAV